VILPSGHCIVKAFNERPVGSGPLRFVSRSKGDHCLLDANPDYWGGRIDVDRVVFQSVPDPDRRVAISCFVARPTASCHCRPSTARAWRRAPPPRSPEHSNLQAGDEAVVARRLAEELTRR
jgi:hypothetical protein